MLPQVDFQILPPLLCDPKTVDIRLTDSTGCRLASKPCQAAWPWVSGRGKRLVIFLGWHGWWKPFQSSCWLSTGNDISGSKISTQANEDVAHLRSTKKPSPLHQTTGPCLCAQLCRAATPGPVERKCQRIMDHTTLVITFFWRGGG